MKTMMRRLDTLSQDSFDAAVAAAMDAVTTQDVEAWVRYAGWGHAEPLLT